MPPMPPVPPSLNRSSVVLGGAAWPPLSGATSWFESQQCGFECHLIDKKVQRYAEFESQQCGFECSCQRRLRLRSGAFESQQCGFECWQSEL